MTTANRYFTAEDAASWLRYRLVCFCRRLSTARVDRDAESGSMDRHSQLHAGSAIAKVTGARSRRSINMQLSPSRGRSLSQRIAVPVMGIRTLPYSSPKTINEVLGVNTKYIRFDMACSRCTFSLRKVSNPFVIHYFLDSLLDF